MLILIEIYSLKRKKGHLSGNIANSLDFVYYNSVHQFTVAAVTHCRPLRGLKQHKCIILQFWRPEF